MVTFTTNKALTLPANSSFVGDWDVPVNGNMTIIDNALGGITTLNLNNSNVILSTAQSQNAFLTLQSTLTGNVAITFPPIAGFYTVQNLCTGSSLFIVVLNTTGGINQVCCPPGEAFDILLDGTGVKYRNFGRIGSYVDYAGTTVPSWIINSSPQPYLNCDGSTFISSNFPVLANLIGNTLPDARGRTRFNLNQGVSRITSTGGIDGTTLFAAGGSQSVALSSTNMPLSPVVDTHFHNTTFGLSGQASPGAAGSGGVQYVAVGATPTSTTAGGSIIVGSTSPTPAPGLNPGYVGGLTLIRAG